MQADVSGFSSLALPYNGYHHLFPRLVALAAVQSDPLWIPTIFLFGAIAALAWVVLLLFSPRLDLPLRPAFALSLVLLPHTGEVMQNLTNAQWIIAVGMILLVLLQDATTKAQRVGDLLSLFAASCTGVFSVLFAPFFLWRAVTRRTLHSSLLFIVTLIGAIVQLIALAHAGAGASAPGTSHSVFAAMPAISTFGERIWGTSLVPLAVLRKIEHWPLGFLGLIGTAWLVIEAIRSELDRVPRLIFLTALGLVYASTLYRFQGQLEQFSGFANGDRYFYLPKLLLLWVLLLEAHRSSPVRWVARALAILVLIATLNNWRFEALQDHHWPDWAAKLRTGRRVVVPINPGDSTFTHPGRSQP